MSMSRLSSLYQLFYKMLTFIRINLLLLLLFFVRVFCLFFVVGSLAHLSRRLMESNVAEV